MRNYILASWSTRTVDHAENRSDITHGFNRFSVRTTGINTQETRNLLSRFGRPRVSHLANLMVTNLTQFNEHSICLVESDSRTHEVGLKTQGKDDQDKAVQLLNFVELTSRC